VRHAIKPKRTSSLCATSSLRGATAHLADALKAGYVYRREDLARLSTAVDRHLRELVSVGKLKKLAQGLYYAPKSSKFGLLPPADKEGVRGFLRDNDFLVKPRFPKKLSLEFLFVDLLNNLEELAEDRDVVLGQARNKLPSFDMARLQAAVNSYGNMATRKRFRQWIDG